MKTPQKLITLGLALALSACATPPPRGPSVMVMPGTGKTFEQFQEDAAVCHRYSLDSTGITAGQAGQQTQTNSAVAGTVLGAMAGAALGAAAGDPGIGAAAGAGTGLLFGSASGQEDAYGAMRTAQDRYDIAYIQCMYAKGNQVPVPANSRAAFEMQMQQQPQQQAPANFWYYCPDQGYYPYVQSCPKGWLQVAPQPAPGAPR